MQRENKIFEVVCHSFLFLDLLLSLSLIIVIRIIPAWHAIVIHPIGVARLETDAHDVPRLESRSTHMEGFSTEARGNDWWFHLL